jgi:rfaE bifunctional protein kinase chain/domain
VDGTSLGDSLKKFANKRILVVGDIMLDRFLWGGVARISPEAPVPVVEVERDELYPGGAANVARNLLPFAASVAVMGVTGDDTEGEQLIGILEDRGLDVSCIQRTPDAPTTVKTRVVARNQQVVRIDRERRTQLTADQLAVAATAIEQRLPDLDAIILQDYGKGFITQELVDRIAEIAGRTGIVITVDPSPANAIIWRAATAIKPNRHEAFRFAGLAESPISDPPSEDPTLRSLAGALFEKWECDQLLITLGEQGMVLCDRTGQKFTHIPPRAHEVFDVSGAGDTSIALFTLALAAELDPVEAAEISNWAAAVVVGKVGTATLTPEELLKAAQRATSQT